MKEQDFDCGYDGEDEEIVNSMFSNYDDPSEREEAIGDYMNSFE